MKFIKQLLCFHTSWARAGWIIQSAWLNKNYYVCKDCGKLKNFGYRTVGHLVFPELPINFDCTYETYPWPSGKDGE